jgi:hypothetical protein
LRNPPPSGPPGTPVTLGQRNSARRPSGRRWLLRRSPAGGRGGRHIHFHAPSCPDRSLWIELYRLDNPGQTGNPAAAVQREQRYRRFIPKRNSTPFRIDFAVVFEIAHAHVNAPIRQALKLTTRAMIGHNGGDYRIASP